jgi:DNA primase
MLTGSGIDFKSISDSVNVRSLIEADLGLAIRKRWLCPYHPDQNPSLGVDPAERRWRCWSCGAHGDAIDWLVRRDGLSVVEAARRLGNIPEPSRPSRATASTVVSNHSTESIKPPTYLDPEWQSAADSIICRAESDLWSRPGRVALAWLRGRGMDEVTIRRFRLGWLSSEARTKPLAALAGADGQPRAIVARRGFVIPWLRPGSWYNPRDDHDEDGPQDPGTRWVGANVRCMGDAFDGPSPKPKYVAFAGSTRNNVYPIDNPSKVPTLIVEGELDALIGTQELGHIVNVVTMGGSNAMPTAASLADLSRSPKWLLAFDRDDAGREAAFRWMSAYPEKTSRVWVPSGKDLADFIVGGGDAVAWIVEVLDRYGLEVPRCCRRVAI